MSAPKRIGVLALQGCVKPHLEHLAQIPSVEGCEVRTSSELRSVDALIVPGGESTTLLKLLKINQLEELFAQRIAEIPVWGICAGAILLAKEVSHPPQKSFGAVAVSIERNAFGRQLDSFESVVLGAQVAFIRAPRIREILDPSVEVLAKLESGEAVAVKQGQRLLTTFHPELSQTRPSVFHTLFASWAEAVGDKPTFSELSNTSSTLPLR